MKKQIMYMRGYPNFGRLAAIVLMVVMTVTACGSDEQGANNLPDTPEPPKKEAVQVRIVSRTEEGTPDIEALRAGLFMVNWQDGKPDELLADHNFVNNQLLTWQDGGWSTAEPIYWNDMDTQADFYAYAPYQENVADARQMTFSVQTDQTTPEAFAQSDLLWGVVSGQSPTAQGFDLILSHQLSRLTVNVTAEAGFEEGELKADDVSVAIGGTRTHAAVDLQTGTVNVLSSLPAETVTCHPNGDLSYTAILLPQQVPFANLIQVDWQGNKYKLQNSFTLEAKRQYTLTVKLKKTKSGFDIGIEGWDIIPEDFGGTVGN